MDRPFAPGGPTFLVTTTAVQAPLATGNCFRVRNLSTTAAQYLTWGMNGNVTSAGAPSAGSPVNQTIGFGISATEKISGLLPSLTGLFLISSLVVGFEVTQGDGL